MDCYTITTETETVKSEWGDRNEEWNVYTAQNGNSIRIRKPMGSRSAREFCIAGSDGCYMERTILNPMLDARDLKGFYTWEQLGRPSMRGPVFDYCLSSKAKSDHRDWPFDPNMVVDSIKDLGVKPFNTYLRGGLGFGSKKFSVDFYANYGLLDLSGDGNPLRKWGVGFGMHIIL